MKREFTGYPGSRISMPVWTRLAILCSFVSFVAAPTRADDPEGCLFCHQYSGLSRYDAAAHRVHLFGIDPTYVRQLRGPHSQLNCTDCHLRDEVSVVPHKTLSKVDCTRQCHIAQPGGVERRFSHENISQMLEQGVHKIETLAKLEPSGGALLGADQSKCLYCHDEPLFRADALLAAAHERGADTTRCAACHGPQLPVNTSYMLRHVVARIQPVRPSLELAQVCSVCHSDPKLLAEQHQDDPVGSYVRSFHGKAVLLGDESAANCLDCHVGPGQNVHVLLGPKDPKSSVHFENLPDSCIRCHKQADISIARAAVHLDLPRAVGSIDYLIAAAFVLITLGTFVPSAILVILELLQLVVGRHAHGHNEMRRLAERLERNPQGLRQLTRFTPWQRVQHWVLVLLFTSLVVTGFPLKFAAQPWAGAVIHQFGGLANSRAVHHWAGVGLMIGFGLHMFTALARAIRNAAKTAGNGQPWIVRMQANLPMVMTPIDLARTGQLMAYLIGFRSERPQFGRFTGPEKFEYFGVMWGTMLLGVTGLLLWFPQFFSYWLGGRSFNIATVFHTYEAFLAIIHVGILHIVNVVLSPHVFPLSPATLSGRTPTSKLAEENGEFVLQVAAKMNLSVDSNEAHGEREYE